MLDAVPDPLDLFARWRTEAEAHGDPVGVMILATSDGAGRPSARAVTLKAWDASGFAFVTDSRSRKAAQLRASPLAAVVFSWPRTDRQVRVEGIVATVDDGEVEAWWAVRPRASRIASIVSEQSAPVPDRAAFERAAAEASARLPADPSRPAHFVGLRIVPEVIEFWEEGPARLHDRLAYRRREEGWDVTHLAP